MIINPGTDRSSQRILHKQHLPDVLIEIDETPTVRKPPAQRSIAELLFSLLVAFLQRSALLNTKRHEPAKRHMWRCCPLLDLGSNL